MRTLSLAAAALLGFVVLARFTFPKPKPVPDDIDWLRELGVPYFYGGGTIKWPGNGTADTWTNTPWVNTNVTGRNSPMPPQSPQPVITSQIPAVVAAILTALAAFGTAFNLFDLTKAQQDAIIGLVAAMLLVIPLLSVAGAWVAHNRVTPIDSPTLAQGTVVTVVTPKGEPNTSTTV